MAKYFNRARMTVTSTGTGALTLGVALTGYQTFAASGVADGDTVGYAIEDGSSWEIGTGIYTASGTTLSRTVTASSNSNTAISVTTNAQIFITALAADLVNASNLTSGTVAAARGGAGTVSGIMKANGSGTVSAASAGSDYLSPPSGTAILKANSGGALANATAGTDYLSPPSGTSILKANSGGALANATAGTDYVAPGGALGTPSSGTLTSCTGLPISTGVSGLASGAATFLATPSSANLASMLTDETGTGANVFATSPTLTTATATGLRETKTSPSISSGTLTLDCSAGNVFAVSLNANITTLSFTNVPSNNTAYGLTLNLTADGTARTITWGSAVKWPGGTAPTLTSTNTKIDTFVMFTHDGGNTWYAFTAGQSL